MPHLSLCGFGSGWRWNPSTLIHGTPLRKQESYLPLYRAAAVAADGDGGGSGYPN